MHLEILSVLIESYNHIRDLYPNSRIALCGLWANVFTCPRRLPQDFLRKLVLQNNQQYELAYPVTFLVQKFVLPDKPEWVQHNIHGYQHKCVVHYVNQMPPNVKLYSHLQNKLIQIYCVPNCIGRLEQHISQQLLKEMQRSKEVKQLCFRSMLTSVSSPLISSNTQAKATRQSQNAITKTPSSLSSLVNRILTPRRQTTTYSTINKMNNTMNPRKRTKTVPRMNPFNIEGFPNRVGDMFCLSIPPDETQIFIDIQKLIPDDADKTPNTLLRVNLLPYTILEPKLDVIIQMQKTRTFPIPPVITLSPEIQTTTVTTHLRMVQVWYLDVIESSQQILRLYKKRVLSSLYDSDELDYDTIINQTDNTKLILATRTV